MAGGSNPFNPFEGMGADFKNGMAAAKAVEGFFQKRALKKLLAEYPYMPSTISSCNAAIKNGEGMSAVTAILAADREAQANKKKQDDFILNPPKVHGSASFDNAKKLKDDELNLLYNFSDCPEKGDSIYLGGLDENTPKGAFPQTALHWSGQSHLITFAPTRTGKAISQIIPNLLRYKGSAVVLDPKGELFQTTSKWRYENVGPVYLLNPFDIDGLQGITHGVNPLEQVKNDVQAEELVELLCPPAKGTDDFFEAEAKSFLGAAVLYFALHMPVENRNLASLRDHIAGLKGGETTWLLDNMSAPDLEPMIVNRMRTFNSKERAKSIPRLSDSLDGVLKMFDNSGIRKATSRTDFTFESLKDEPATVYLAVPFEQLQANARYINIMMTSALGAVLRNPRRPKIPLLYIFDEFLALPPMERFVDALRTHAGAGARLWFFLQDQAALEARYPNSWKSFMQAEVECYFGIDDYFTAKQLSESLGTTTEAVASNNSTGTTGGGTHYSYNDTSQLVAKQLMTPDEVKRYMAYPPSHNVFSQSRSAIYHLRGATLKARVSPYSIDPLAKERIGSMLED